VPRYRFIAAERAVGEWPVVVMCRVLQISKSAFYAWCENPTRGGPSDRLLRVHIGAIHRESRGTYGSPRILEELREQGFHVSRKRVARLMREQGIAGLPARKKFRVATTDSDHDDPIADNLLNRDFEAKEPNQVWVGDITYLRTSAGFVYLAVLIDLHSRRVVGWAVADHMRTSLVQEALRRAVALRTPPPGLIQHTDRGSQYASASYRKDLDTIGAIASMSRKGDCWDNAVAESFFGTLEQELAGRSTWRTGVAAEAAVVDYIVTFYNRKRRHRTLGQVSPLVFEQRWAEAQFKAVA
jgi:putative transposase